MNKKLLLSISIITISLILLTILVNTTSKAAVELTNVPQIQLYFKDKQGNTINNIKIVHENKIINSQEDDWTDNVTEYTTTDGTIIIQHSDSASYTGKIKVTEIQQGYSQKPIEFGYTIENENNTPTGMVINNLKNIDGSSIKIKYTDVFFVDIIIDEVNNEPGLQLGTLPNIGNTVQFIADNESNSQSASISETVEYFNQNGITINSIKDINGQNVSLNGQELLGTGAKINTNNGEYTAVVYGDTSGDGEINAADISIVIDDFLGNDSNLIEAQQAAGDVFQDDELNAGDISLMIDCFLGNLEGSILQQ